MLWAEEAESYEGRLFGVRVAEGDNRDVRDDDATVGTGIGPLDVDGRLSFLDREGLNRAASLEPNDEGEARVLLDEMTGSEGRLMYVQLVKYP